LERKRRCGWLELDELENPRVIWARGNARLTTCPTSYITPESIALVEEFHAWKMFGAANVYRLPARLVETIFVLENELRAEKDHARN
jgi:hypothetical protein